MKLFTLDDQVVIRKAGTLAGMNQKAVIAVFHKLLNLRR